MRGLSCVLSLVILSVAASPAAAQSPNTATINVVVVDQTGAVVKDANVSVVNTATGATREATSDATGSALIAALPLTGTYTVSVTKSGFTAEDVKDLALRGGETASLKIKLVATGGSSSVTVYGTSEGIRNDPELGTSLTSARIDETPVLGRKVTALPLLNAAFRPAKGTGDLFINAVYFVTGAGGRRETDFVVDGATGNEPWGRQTMFSTLPIGAVQEMQVQSRAFSAEYGWTSSTAVNIVTKAGTNVTHGEVLFLGRPGGLQPDTMSASAQCPGAISTCVPPTTNGAPNAIVPPDIPDSLAQGSFALGGAIVPDRTHYFVAADLTSQDRTASITSPLSSSSTIVGHYRQALVDARLDHTINGNNSLTGRFNLDRFYDDNPQDAVSGNNLPSTGRTFSRHTYAFERTSSIRTPTRSPTSSRSTPRRSSADRARRRSSRASPARSRSSAARHSSPTR
jgi:Carboxypeptidase regulatory-like domain